MPRTSPRPPLLNACVLAAALAAAAAPVHAQVAPSAEPVPGMWAFEGELTGQPGRSLQIDTQLGRGMVVSYLGYRADGSALFLQASGYRAAGDNGFTGELREFRNGPVIGGGAGSGEVAGSAGPLRLAFDTPTSGTVTLPGEAPRRIVRFAYGAQRLSRVASLDQDMQLTVHSTAVRPETAMYKMRFANGTFQLSQTGTDSGSLCTYSGPYRLQGESIVSEGTRICTDASGTQQRSPYLSGQFRFDNENFLSGSVRIDGHDVFFTGPCKAWAQIGNSPIAPCSLASYGAEALQPGMWSFDGELGGRPGRSLQIDRLDNSGMLILSYLGYRNDGSSVFLQGATHFGGLLRFNTYSFPLKEFRGGPVIGGPVTPGEEAATVGDMQLAFDSPTSGTITLPGEAPRRISRYRYEDHTVRFDKAFEGYGYPFAQAPGNPISIDLVARDGVFRMDSYETPTYRRCQYRGSYQLTGEGLATEGTRSCAVFGGATTTSYSGRLAVDENGLLRARMTEDGGRSPVLITAGCSNGRLCTREELQRPR
ncbi:hypothetical protein [Acidovorax sp. NCPPB 4044]|uniref:hypothetical protein n=1 Tax=Acidovorax sp. NCPPB 4044 TaxID=2940490 RepID=UPI0023041DF2|nr:hypothetical protein [Acidovorax sp. NCPPB 4044]MDA8523077.1 hypothetical protein [Acidovorax sp. NCPPB 4044]